MTLILDALSYLSNSVYCYSIYIYFFLFSFRPKVHGTLKESLFKLKSKPENERVTFSSKQVDFSLSQGSKANSSYHWHWAGEPGYTTTVTLAEDLVPHQSAYITSYLAYLRSLA